LFISFIIYIFNSGGFNRHQKMVEALRKDISLKILGGESGGCNAEKVVVVLLQLRQQTGVWEQEVSVALLTTEFEKLGT
jgi:peptidyl-prolyl cis-trans isomerase D